MAIANGFKAIINIVVGLWLVYSCVLMLVGLGQHGGTAFGFGLGFFLVGLAVRYGLFYIIDSFSDE